MILEFQMKRRQLMEEVCSMQRNRLLAFTRRRR
jgi:hypothetical protein